MAQNEAIGVNLDTISQAKATLLDLAIRFGPKVLVALLILMVGIFVGSWVARVVIRTLHRFDFEPPVRQLIARVARVLVFGLFAMMALQNLGVELLPLIAGLGVAGAGIALATQGVLGNMVAGLTIIFSKPYRVGDYISIVGVEGQVEVITLSSTTLAHVDQSKVVVPNRKVVGEILHNFGRIRQAEVYLGVGYAEDLPKVLEIIQALVKANVRVLADPAPIVSVVSLGDSTVRIGVKPWVKVGDYGIVGGELNVVLVEAMRERGISIPFPQREVRLISAEVA